MLSGGSSWLQMLDLNLYAHVIERSSELGVSTPIHWIVYSVYQGFVPFKYSQSSERNKIKSSFKLKPLHTNEKVIMKKDRQELT